MRQLVLSIVASILCIESYAQNFVSANAVDFNYKIIDSELVIELSAPTTGWISIGFNDMNSPIGADYKMFCVKDGKVEAGDYKNMGKLRDNRPDSEVGGEPNINVQGGGESSTKTWVSFSIPLDSKDASDFKIEPNKPMWLILAYSSQDDFSQTSRLREHFMFSFSN